MSLRRKSLDRCNLAKCSIPGTHFALGLAAADASISPSTRKENGGVHNHRIESRERRLMMDLVYVLAIVGFFALCIAYTYAFDRI